MALIFAIIVSIAFGMLIWAIVDKFVSLFMSGWLELVVSLVIGAAVVWIASDWYMPLLMEAFGA